MPAKAPARRSRGAQAAPEAAPQPAPVMAALPEPAGLWKFLALLLAFCSPGAGGLLALLYWAAPAGPARRFSRWCLALAALGCLLSGAADSFRGGESLIQPY
ncbi:MAG TPA: hypothetical protein VK842_01025 [bacterium]|jgi:hypothetical protein|nr:hypothetical protein [bacterium]